MAEKYLKKNTGIPVQIEKLNYSLFPLSFDMENSSLLYNIGETQIKIEMERLSGQGNIHRLRKGQKPYLDTLLVRGLEADVLIKTTGKVIYWHDLASDLSHILSFVRYLDLENSYIKLRFDDGEVIAKQLNFSLYPGDKEGNFLFMLNAPEISASVNQALSGISGQLNISGLLQLSEAPSLFTSLYLDVTSLSFENQSIELDKPIEGKLKLYLPPEENVLSLKVYQLSLPPHIWLTAEAKADFNKPFYSFSTKIRMSDIGKSKTLLKSYLPEININRAQLQVSGPAALQGKGFADGDENHFLFDGDLDLGPLDLRYKVPGIETKALFMADLNVAAGTDKKEVKGFLTLTEGRIQMNEMTLNNLEVQVPLSYAREELILEEVSWTGLMEETSLSYKENKINFPAVSFKGEASFLFPSMMAELGFLVFSFPSLPPLTINGKAGPGIDGEKHLSLSWPGIKIQKVLTLFPQILPDRLLSWEPEGIFDLKAGLKHRGNINKNAWKGQAAADVSGLTFHNPEFTIASESLSSQINLQYELKFPLKTVPFSLDLQLTQGESLWKTYYLNWQKYNLKTTLKGALFPLEQNLQDLSFKLDIGELGEFSAEGKIGYGRQRLIETDANLSLFDLTGLQEILTGDESFYALQGTIRTSAHIKKSGNSLDVKGLLRMEDCSLKDEKKNLQIQGIEASIPFQIPFNNDSSPFDKEKKSMGFLSVGDLMTPVFSLDSLYLDIHSRPGRFVIKPLSFKLGDGKFYLGETSLDYFPEFKLVSSLSLEKTEILSLLPNLELPVQGTLQAEFSSVVMDQNQLKTDGTVEMNVFDGRIKADSTGVKKPFSKNRTFLTNITFQDINLEKLTGIVPFGRVTGIIDGEVRDLAVSYGQPERFFLHIESDKKRNIPQLFSLKAADDISVIGTGTKNPVSSSSWLTAFVNNFRYQKIGIVCSLKNDVFNLRGTITEGGEEYLVKGPLFFGIDVINKMPENTIRFKDMLDRLKRVGRIK